MVMLDHLAVYGLEEMRDGGYAVIVEVFVQLHFQLQVGHVQCSWESLLYYLSVKSKKQARGHGLGSSFRS